MTYVDDVTSAMAEAKEAAGDKNVLVHGAGIARLALAAGALDELELHVIPVLFGQGRRLFDGLAPEQIELERTRILEGEDGVTHMHYKVLAMGKLIATAQATLDGVVDPVGPWVQPDGDHGSTPSSVSSDRPDVLGRKTYEGLAGYWPSQSGRWADMVNSMRMGRVDDAVRRARLERDPARRRPRGLGPEAEGRRRRRPVHARERRVCVRPRRARPHRRVRGVREPARLG